MISRKSFKPNIFIKNIVTADGLAVDWIYSHLYWTDAGTNAIGMSGNENLKGSVSSEMKILKSLSNLLDLDGNMITTIVQDNLQEPRAISLHPAKG